MSSPRASKCAERIRDPEAETLSCLVAVVPGVEVGVHRRSQRHADEVLQTVGHISLQEPSVGDAITE